MSPNTAQLRVAVATNPMKDGGEGGAIKAFDNGMDRNDGRKRKPSDDRDRHSKKESSRGQAKQNKQPPKQGAIKKTGDGEEGKSKGKGKGAIDDIFSGVKRLKEEKAEEEAERVATKKKMKAEHKRRQANPFTGEGAPAKRWAWADEVKPVRFDDEGLPIYTWGSLRIGQGGGTELCPFDCDCCF